MNRAEAHWLEQIRLRCDGVRDARVLVACSGGGDSMALLCFLARVAPRLGLDLLVGHAHHGLRAEADADADLVRTTCRRLDLDLVEGWLDVREHAAKEGLGLETAARELRWAWLRAEAEGSGAIAVATGHTLEDHTETVFLRLLRGGGSGALTPLPAREGLRWSPLIEATRAELRCYLQAAGLPWREDATNAEGFTPRNRLRPRLAELRQESPSLDRHLWETHRQVRELEELRDSWLSESRGVRWDLEEAGIHLAPDLAASELRWILATAFEHQGWSRSSDLFRPLAAWLATRLASRNPAPRTWGGWSLEALPGQSGNKPWRRLRRRA